MSRRSGLRYDLSAGHRERDVLLREVPIAGHGHRRLRFRPGHVHFRAVRRFPGVRLRLAGHDRRDRRPGVAVHAVRYAVPAADRGRTAAADDDRRGQQRHVHGDRVEHHRAAGRVRTAERRLRGQQPIVRSHTERERRRRRQRRRRVETPAAAGTQSVAQHVAVQRGEHQHVRQRQTVEIHAQPTGADSRLVRLQRAAEHAPEERDVLRQSEPETDCRERRRHYVPKRHILQRQSKEHKREPQEVRIYGLSYGGGGFNAIRLNPVVRRKSPGFFFPGKTLNNSIP